MTLRVNNSSGNLKVVNGQGGRLNVEGVLPVAFGDLVAYYPFRQGTGVDVTAGDSRFGDTTDYSATVNGATFKPDSGVHDIQNGANSGAFDFDGTDDTLDLGTVADSDQSLTVMAWVEFDTLRSGDEDRILTKRDQENSSDGSFKLHASASNDLRFLARNNGSFTLADSSFTAPTGQFIHAAGRYNFSTGELTVFVNGTPRGTATVGQLSSNSSQPWRIGEDKPAGVVDFLDGTIDGVRIYQAALSNSQIYQIYKNTRPVTRLDSLAARYTFNDGAAQDQTAGVPVSGDSTDYSGTINGTAIVDDGGVNDG